MNGDADRNAPLAPVAALIKEGEYSMVCVEVAQKKIFADIRVVADFEFFPPHSPALDGITLQWFAVLHPAKGSKRVRLGSKFFAAWCLANGRQRPGRDDRMSPRIFKGKLFRVKVETANVEADEFRRYSVVREILSLEAGGPTP